MRHGPSSGRIDSLARSSAMRPVPRTDLSRRPSLCLTRKAVSDVVTTAHWSQGTFCGRNLFPGTTALEQETLGQRHKSPILNNSMVVASGSSKSVDICGAAKQST